MNLRKVLSPRQLTGKRRLEWQDVRTTLLTLAAATLCALLLRTVFSVGNESVIMVFLLGVLFSAVLTASSLYGIIASLLSFMLFNFLFTEPRFTFLIYASRDLILLLFFMVTAVVSGLVTSRLQEQIRLTAENERTSRTLYRIALGFLSASGEEDLAALAKEYAEENTGLACEVYLRAELPNPGCSQYTDYPVASPEGPVGVLRVFQPWNERKEPVEMVITAIATQLGSAVSRERLRAAQEETRLAMERERQRSTLLRSVAHDLRSPLTALYGSSCLLADEGASLAEEERRKLAANLSEEILWLTNLVENILNMTRISDGQLNLASGKEAVDDLMTNAVSHVRRLLRGRDFAMSLPEEVTLVPADGKLIVQVIVNLLENAVKHTPDTAAIRLGAEVKGETVEISVSDTGPGVRPELRERIFERFVTLDQSVTDGKRGLGLGLAICKAIVDAHGGRIWVEENAPRGARFVFSLPLEV